MAKKVSSRELMNLIIKKKDQIKEISGDKDNKKRQNKQELTTLYNMGYGK